MSRPFVKSALFALVPFVVPSSVEAKDPPGCAAKAREWSASPPMDRVAKYRFKAAVDPLCKELLTAIDGGVDAAPVDQKATHPIYRGHGFVIELLSCAVTNDGAECSGIVTTSYHTNWPILGGDRLIRAGGKSITVRSIAMGDFDGPVSSVSTARHAPVVKLAVDIPTKFTYKFLGDFDPTEVQAMELSFQYALNRGTALLKPIPWKF